MDGEEQGEGQEGTNMYTLIMAHIIMFARNSAPQCTQDLPAWDILSGENRHICVQQCEM